MSKEGFNWKSLFINESENTTKKEESSKSNSSHQTTTSGSQVNKFPRRKDSASISR